MNYKQISITMTLILFSVVMLVSSTGFGADGLPKAWFKAGSYPQNTAAEYRTGLAQETAADAVKSWLATNAIRLSTVEAGHGFADMQPLKGIISNARIVSLGEATHGTREFFQLKHRMLEFLATEMGFTIFSIEANMPEAYRLNDYVLNGNGDPAKLIKGMYFWTWDTQEVLGMVMWMREFNKSGKGRVQFTGFDMQTPDVAAGIVSDFVASADPNYTAPVRQAIAATDLSFGVATATFPVKDAAGKRVRCSGYIKTEGVTTGFAGLLWRVDGPSGVLAFDNMQNRGSPELPTGSATTLTCPWRLTLRTSILVRSLRETAQLGSMDWPSN